MTWEPGKPVLTDDDHQQWAQWRKDRKREQQRQRRARYPRIDYYPTPAAHAIVTGLCRPRVGHDLSSIISRIIEQWSESHRNNQMP